MKPFRIGGSTGSVSIRKWPRPMAAAEIVLFDLGGVLLPFDLERRVRAMVQALGITAVAARAFMASDIHTRLDVGQASEAEVAAALSEVAGRPLTTDETRVLIL